MTQSVNAFSASSCKDNEEAKEESGNEKKPDSVRERDSLKRHPLTCRSHIHLNPVSESVVECLQVDEQQGSTPKKPARRGRPPKAATPSDDSGSSLFSRMSDSD